jgi:regulator of RNase E activity RraA
MIENEISALCRLSTATLTMVLLKRGLRNVWIRGANLLEPNTRRIAGPAVTMRFVPGREDLATPASLSSKRSTRYAIEEMPQGSVAVVASCGVDDAGIFGDIPCARMARRGAAGLITDGKMRDVEGIRKTGLPIWSSGVCAPPSVAQLTFVDWRQPVGCGDGAVFPDDVIVADQDGAIVVPQSIVSETIEAAQEMEALEEWILERVLEGRKLPGLYPRNEQAMAEFRNRNAKTP